MKEYVIKEIKPNKYEYGYRIQKLDIKLMMEFGLKVPDKIKEVYGNGFTEDELKEYVYFHDAISCEFISSQYYLRDLIEFSNMNLFDLELALKFYNKRIQGLINTIHKIGKTERLIDLETNLKIVTNEVQSVMYLRDEMIRKHNKKK